MCTYCCMIGSFSTNHEGLLPYTSKLEIFPQYSLETLETDINLCYRTLSLAWQSQVSLPNPEYLHNWYLFRILLPAPQDLCRTRRRPRFDTICVCKAGKTSGCKMLSGWVCAFGQVNISKLKYGVPSLVWFMRWNGDLRVTIIPTNCRLPWPSL